MKLGQPNVDAMLGRMTWRQLLEWMVFADLEPFDEERADIRAAQLVAAIANANRNPKKRRRPYAIRDMLIRFGDSPDVRPRQSWQEQKAIGRMFYEMSLRNPDERPSASSAHLRRHKRRGVGR